MIEFFAVVYENNGQVYIYVNPTGFINLTESPSLAFDGLFTVKMLAGTLYHTVLANGMYSGLHSKIQLRKFTLNLMPLD